MLLSETTAARALELVRASQADFAQRFPSDTGQRQPLHVVYGGLHLFTKETPEKLARVARSMLDAYAPTPGALAERFNLSVDVAQLVRARVVEKLETEGVEDYRIDSEDGYGHRPDEEEDRHAEQAARALKEVTKRPPFIGLRVKSFTPELAPRAIRTLERFFSTLGDDTPPGFIVTLPKVTDPRQLTALVDVLEALEATLSLPRLRVEAMIESAPGLYDDEGRLTLSRFIEASRRRLFAVHVGAYDYTASMDVAGPDQTLAHVACDHLRQLMKTTFSGTGVFVADGATTHLPIAPHRGDALTDAQRAQNERVVTEAWKTHATNIHRALSQGFFQGWDLHPGQLVPRYVATFSYFWSNRDAMAARLSNFISRRGQATTVGTSFDDAATGQGLLTFFLRGRSCGAFTEADVATTGLSPAELALRDFAAIVRARRTP